MQPEKSYTWQQEKPDPNLEYKLVKFKKDTEKFVGTDMRIYGPFQKGDLCRIPEVLKTALEKQGRIS